MTTFPVYYSSRPASEVPPPSGQVPELPGKGPGPWRLLGPILYGGGISAIFIPKVGVLGVFAAIATGLALLCVLQGLNAVAKRRQCSKRYPASARPLCEFCVTEYSKTTTSFGYVRLEACTLLWVRTRGDETHSNIAVDLVQVELLVVCRYGPFSTRIWVQDEAKAWVRFGMPTRFVRVLKILDDVPGLSRIGTESGAGASFAASDPVRPSRVPNGLPGSSSLDRR